MERSTTLGSATSDTYSTNWTVDGGTFMTAPYVQDNCVSIYHYPWWPNTWVSNYCGQGKFGQAFRIAQKLMEAKIVKVDNDVAKFVKLVNVIAAEI